MSAPDDAGQAGWTLVQLSELVRRAEELLLDGITLVGPHAHAAMATDATIALGPDELRRISGALSEGVEIAEQLELLAGRLSGARVAAPYAAVRDAAAADLADGIVDPRRLLIAARLLDAAHGWPALAASLSAGDVVTAWGGLRDVDRDAVERVAAAAGVDPAERLSACAPERLAALAVGLRRHAGQPAS
jgi:hypothetical protein